MLKTSGANKRECRIVSLHSSARFCKCINVLKNIVSETSRYWIHLKLHIFLFNLYQRISRWVYSLWIFLILKNFRVQYIRIGESNLSKKFSLTALPRNERFLLNMLIFIQEAKYIDTNLITKLTPYCDES